MNKKQMMFATLTVTGLTFCLAYYFSNIRPIHNRYQRQLTEFETQFTLAKPKLDTAIQTFEFPEFLKPLEQKTGKNADEYIRKSLQPKTATSPSKVEVAIQKKLDESKFRDNPKAIKAGEKIGKFFKELPDLFHSNNLNVSKIKSTDYDWMKRLFEFDYWNPYSTSTDKPNFSIVFQTLKHRYDLIEKNPPHDLKEIIRQNRKMIQLMFSTETTAGQGHAITLLTIEDRILKNLHNSGQYADILEINASTLSTLQALTRNSEVIFSFWQTSENLDFYLSNPKLKAFKCAAIRDNLTAVSTFSDLISMNQSEQWQRVLSEAKNGDCHLENMKAIIDGGLADYKRSPYYQVIQNRELKSLNWLPSSIKEKILYESFAGVMIRNGNWAMLK